MDLTKGYRLDRPNILVTWDTTWEELRELLSGWDGASFHAGDKLGSRRLANFRCASLGDLWHSMTVTFNDGVLQTFDLSFPHGSLDAQGIIDFNYSFPLFQQHLQSTFGSPTVLREGYPGAASVEERFAECEWKISNVHIRHAIDEYWGPVERLTICRLTSAT